MKVNVIGTSGSGKSTLAKRIAAELDIPYIEMDRLYWCPDWQGTPDAILLEKLETTLKASAEWVLDGNYNRTRPVKWRDVDRVMGSPEPCIRLSPERSGAPGTNRNCGPVRETVRVFVAHS